jgi:osmotically-inducible protein OsmY
MTSFEHEDTTRSRWTAFVAGASIGAALMYLIDPAAGARRRGLIRGKMSRAAHKTADGFDAARRDISNRAYGGWATVRRWRTQEEVPDHILLERVRATLGRYVSHPRSIDVEMDDGCVILRGQILKHEVARLIRAINGVRGVSSVDNRLEQHEHAGNIPSLQGGMRA